MIRRLIPIIKKEFRQIRRDKRVLAILTLVPALLLLLNGFALNFDVSHIKMAVIDQENSKTSRDFLNAFVTSGYFDYVQYLNSTDEAMRMIDDAKIRAAIVIPTDFTHKLLSNETTDIQVLVDGMDSNAASTILAYVQAVTLQYSQKIVLTNLSKMGRGSYLPIQYDARVWYNPELKSAKFLVPGLIGFILAITAVIATSLSIVKEKERNTIEQIDVSPITSFELIVGKMIPYALISLVAATLVIVAAYFLFDVVVKGSYFYLFGATLVVYHRCSQHRVVRLDNSRQPASGVSACIAFFHAADDDSFGLHVSYSEHAVVAPDSHQHYTGKILSRHPAVDYFERCGDCRFLGSGSVSYDIHVVYAVYQHQADSKKH